MKAPLSKNMREIMADPQGREQLRQFINGRAESANITLSNGTTFVVKTYQQMQTEEYLKNGTIPRH